MRLIFCDAAGLASVQQEPIALHAALIIEGDHQWSQINPEVAAIRDGLPLSRDEKREFEFHAATLFQGDRNLHLSRSEREKVQRAFLNLIPHFSLPYVIGGVYKELAEQTVKPYSFAELGITYEDVAFLICLERVETWFRRNLPDEKGLLICDRSDVAEIMENTVKVYRDKALPAQDAVTGIRLDHIVELPLFTHSHKSWGVQLADHVCFFAKRKLMGKENSSELFEIIRNYQQEFRAYPIPVPKEQGGVF